MDREADLPIDGAKLVVSQYGGDTSNDYWVWNASADTVTHVFLSGPRAGETETSPLCPGDADLK